MAPHLRLLAGTSPDTMVPITHIVNRGIAHHVSSPFFEGEIAVYIKGFSPSEHGGGDAAQNRSEEPEYFRRGDRVNVTWGIQVKGRFLVPYSADDILFGNTFDRPLRLPWGTSAVLKFMNYIDPALEHDLTSSTKPWALSPLIATMPHFAHTRLGAPSSPSQHHSTPESKFPPSHSIQDSTSQLHLTLVEPDNLKATTTPSRASLSSTSSSGSNSSVSARGHASHASLVSASSSRSSRSKSSFVALNSTSSSQFENMTGGSEKIKQAIRNVRHRRSWANGGVQALKEREKELKKLETASQRRAYFANRARRREIVFGPEDLITVDFCYGFISFAPSLSLQLPGGLSFDLMRYWDGQPVRFVCCERPSSSAVSSLDSVEENRDPWGRIFWCVTIEVVDDEGRDGDEGF